MRPLHPQKAFFPILVTEFGIVTDVKPLQNLKASPILVTVYSSSFTFIEDGIIMLPEYFPSPTVTSAILAFETKL